MEKLVLRCRISGSFVSCHLPFLIGFQWNIYLSVVFPFRFLSCKTISCQIIQTVIPFDSTDDLVMFSLSMHVILALRVTSLFILSSSWIFIFLVFYFQSLFYFLFHTVFTISSWFSVPFLSGGDYRFYIWWILMHIVSEEFLSFSYSFLLSY